MKLGASNLLKWGVSAVTKELSSDIGKRLIDEGIKHAPDLYRLGISRINSFFFVVGKVQLTT